MNEECNLNEVGLCQRRLKTTVLRTSVFIFLPITLFGVGGEYVNQGSNISTRSSRGIRWWVRSWEVRSDREDPTDHLTDLGVVPYTPGLPMVRE